MTKHKHQPFIEITIGGRKGDLPPDTSFLTSSVDPKSGRTIVYIPLILNETPQAGKPYTDYTGQTNIPSVVAKTTIRECTIEMPGPLGGNCTLKGFASLQIAALSPEEVMERWADNESASESGTLLVYDWETRQYKVVIADETDDISTTHAFDSQPPNYGVEPASSIQKKLSPQGKMNQSPSQNVPPNYVRPHNPIKANF